MAVKTNKVTNANVYDEGKSLLGQAEEINLPEVGFSMAEHKALGMVGVRQYPGGIEKMEGKIKWNSFYADTYGSFANPFKAKKLQVRSSVQEWEGGDLVAEKPLVVYLTIQPKKVPGGNFKSNDNVEYETDFTCSYMKVEYDGNLVTEIDVDNNIFFVGGEDLLSAYRANLGI